MTPAALLADLQARRVRLVARDGKINLRAPVGVLTGQDRDAVTRNRDALLLLLAAAPGAPAEPGSVDQVAREGEPPGTACPDQDPEGPGQGSDNPAPAPGGLAEPPPACPPEPGPVCLAEPPSLALHSLPLERTAPGGRPRLSLPPPEASSRLPLLALFEAEGQDLESWLLPQGSSAVEALETLGARLLHVGNWTRADLPAGAAPSSLLPLLLAACPPLEPPPAELLARREALARPAPGSGRTWLPSVLAEDLALLAPLRKPPGGLPATCPACRSRVPKWAALEEAGRFLCGRCWKPWQGALPLAARREDLRVSGVGAGPLSGPSGLDSIESSSARASPPRSPSSWPNSRPRRGGLDAPKDCREARSSSSLPYSAFPKNLACLRPPSRRLFASVSPPWPPGGGF